jgi:hypothetical protein
MVRYSLGKLSSDDEEEGMVMIEMAAEVAC